MTIGMEDAAAIRIEVTTLGDLLLGAHDRFAAREALVFPGIRLTFADLYRRSMLRARELWAAGVRPGEHVGILLPTSVDFVETLFGVALCGGISVMLNTRYRPAELAYVADNADLVGIVTSDAARDHGNFVARIAEAFPDRCAAGRPLPARSATSAKLRFLFSIDDAPAPPGFISVRTLADELTSVSDTTIHQARIAVLVRDPAIILYTSGTSANPKGCVLSHEAVVRQVRMLALRWSYTTEDRVWSPLPLFHVAAMSGLLAILDKGGSFIGMPHFDPADSLDMIEHEAATSLFVPFVTFLQAMMLEDRFESVDLSRVRHGNTCFAAQPEKVGQGWREKAPHIFYVGTYGLTEAFGVVTTGGEGIDPEMGFKRLGYPLPGLSVRVVDPATGQDRACDEPGEVLVRGFSILDEYYHDPDKTAATIDALGWFHTGDIGSLDAHGHLMFHGRTKDMLKVGGENVAAAEVEELLAAHPGVKLAQVVGIPDERLVEVPVAFVEPSPDQTVSAEELIAFARQRIAGFKVPRHVRFVNEWPMSASKIQKFKLRQDIMRELGIEG